MVFFGICLLLGIAFVLYAFALMNSNKKITLKYFILMLIGILLLIFAVILLINNKKSDTPEPSPTTIVEKTEGPKTTEIPSLSPYATETPTYTLIPTPTLTPSPTFTVEPTQTETPTPTLAPTPTPAPTPTEDPNTFKTVKYDPTTIVKPENWNNSIIYLTFDDGPSYSITPKLLDILKKYNVKATFFVVGKYLDSNLYNTLKRALEEGHQVGIHTYCHDYDVIYKSVDAYLDDFNKIDNLLKTKLNYEATVFRFPGGTSNTVSRSYCKGVMTQLVSIMKEKGYVETDWNVSPEDATNNLTTQQVFDGILKELNVNNKENIVLMHDYSGLDTTAEAVDKFIPWALQQGYAFDRVTVGHGILQHKVQN